MRTCGQKEGVPLSDFNAEDGAAGAASMTAQAQERVQETAQQAGQKAAQMLREQTEARASQASDELRAVADALRRSGHALHAEGKESSGGAVDAVTDRIDRLSRYLGGTGGDQMLHDIESFGRRRPWGIVGIGLGVGLLASRFLKASSETRYATGQRPPAAPTPAPPALPAAVREPVTQVGYPAYRAE
jgi:ElaB/YqjD/DUF883 family membrane-anchored ribosome-binding protein